MYKEKQFQPETQMDKNRHFPGFDFCKSHIFAYPLCFGEGDDDENYNNFIANGYKWRFDLEDPYDGWLPKNIT